MIFHAVSHPIDTVAHPTIPVGFRWAVSASDDPTNLSACLGAGWSPDADSAAWIAAQAAHIAATAFGMGGGVAQCAQLILSYDPVPADADFLNTGA